MHIKESQIINDLKIVFPEVFYDFRGEYVETFSKKNYTFCDRNGSLVEFIEDDISVSRQNILRGLHGDDKTWKLIQCLYGEIYLVVADLRKESDTYLKWEAFTINDKNRKQIIVPAGCANGHLCLSEKCIFSYKQSQYYSGGHNQFTIRWDEPKLNIYWGNHQPILSLRDSSASYLD